MTLILHIAAVEFTLAHFVAPHLHALQQQGFDVCYAASREDHGEYQQLRPFEGFQLALSRRPSIKAITRGAADVIRLVRRLEPDVVHLHSPAAALVVRAIPRNMLGRRTRLVTTVHGFPFSWPLVGSRARLLEAVERYQAGSTDALLFVSSEDLDMARRRRYDSRLLYVGNGVSADWFAMRPPQPPVGDLQLAFVGRMVIEKGIPELLLALKGSTGITLHLIGAALPSDRDSAEPIIDAAAIDPTTGPKLVRHGALTPAGVRTVMSRMHALVLPSHREGLPTSVIEGLASGRPCVVTDVRGSRELVEDGLSGRVVPARDPEALLEAMSSLRELDSAGFARMSAHAVAAASRHRENSVLQRLLSAYSELGVRP